VCAQTRTQSYLPKIHHLLVHEHASPTESPKSPGSKRVLTPPSKSGVSGLQHHNSSSTSKCDRDTMIHLFHHCNEMNFTKDASRSINLVFFYLALSCFLPFTLCLFILALVVAWSSISCNRKMPMHAFGVLMILPDIKVMRVSDEGVGRIWKKTCVH